MMNVKKADDCLKMSAIFEEAGLPRPSWRWMNQEWIPEWSTKVDQTLVEKIARGFQPSKPVAKRPIASPSPQAPPAKRGRGRPKKNK